MITTPRPRLGIVLFSAALAFCVTLSLTGCDEETRTVVAPEPPSQPANLSKVSAAVGQLKKDNASNPDGPAKTAVDLQAGIALSGLDKAKPEDVLKAAEVSALVFAGRIEEATKRATAAEIELGQLRETVKIERDQAKADMVKIIDDAEDRVRNAEAKANKEAYLRVVTAFALLGGIITLAGIACAVTGWSRIGVLGIPAGILIGGSGLLWGKPWFLITVGIGVILVSIAGGIRWAVSVHDARAKLATPTQPQA